MVLYFYYPLVVKSNKGVTRFRGGRRTSKCKKNKNRNSQNRRKLSNLFWIYFNKVDAKQFADNKLPFLEQASETLVDINNQEVLDIASCFDDILEYIPIGNCGGIKSNSKITYWPWCWTTITYNYKIKQVAQAVICLVSLRKWIWYCWRS